MPLYWLQLLWGWWGIILLLTHQNSFWGNLFLGEGLGIDPREDRLEEMGIHPRWKEHSLPRPPATLTPHLLHN